MFVLINFIEFYKSLTVTANAAYSINPVHSKHGTVYGLATSGSAQTLTGRINQKDIVVRGQRHYDATQNMYPANFTVQSGLVGSETLTFGGSNDTFSTMVANESAFTSVSLSNVVLADGSNGGLAANYSISAGQTTTATHNFVDADHEFGSRSVNVTFNLTSIAIPADHYSKDHSNYTGFGWNTITGITINSQTGFWRNNEDFVLKIALTSNNPFASNHPTEGTLQEAGAGYKVTAVGFTNKQLRLKDNGVLVVEDIDGTDVVWSSDNAPITSEPKVVAGTTTPIEVSGTCGKRISDCRLRFPNGDDSGGIPFGSFPSVGINR